MWKSLEVGKTLHCLSLNDTVIENRNANSELCNDMRNLAVDPKHN